MHRWLLLIGCRLCNTCKKTGTYSITVLGQVMLLHCWSSRMVYDHFRLCIIVACPTRLPVGCKICTMELCIMGSYAALLIDKQPSIDVLRQQVL